MSKYAFVECDNERCPKLKDGICCSEDPVTLSFHPSYQVVVSCWWDDNDDESDTEDEG
jgi:hypothetical protein